MSQGRGRLGASVWLTVVAAGTTWVALWSWGALVVAAGRFLNPLLLIAALIGTVGVATRWWRWPSILVVSCQVVLAGMATSMALCGSPLPVGTAWEELRTSLADALATSHAYAAPVPDGPPPVAPLLIVGGVACLLLVDVLACTLRRPALAGLPLLAIFTVPVSVVGDEVAWWVFALAAAGYLTLMFLQERELTTRWGRPLGGERETGDSLGAGGHTVRGAAGLIGSAATALAIFIPAVIPATGLQVFDFGAGNGNGDDIRVDNPTADLVRDLKRGDDDPLVQVTTNDPNPSYLRILTLTRFSDAEWSPGDRDVPADALANGLLPPPQGVSTQVGREEYAYDVTITSGFDSRWLPTQPPISRIDADGDWRYDRRTMDFLAGDDDLTTAGLHYTMTAVHLDLTARDLADAAPSSTKVDEIFTELPDDLPPIVSTLAAEVTKNAKSPYQEAVALQEWFRETGGFTYSLDRAPGSGTDALVSFLSDGPGGRTGYCEQFAAAMAAMARTLDIPARVAVGFLNPTSEGNRTWTYSAHDMHAWPELYFDGAGWVRFEPTPAGRAADVPGYTVPGSGRSDQPTEEPTDSQSASAPMRSSRPSESSSPADAAGSDDSTADSGVAWAPIAGGLAGVLVLAGALLLPRVLRTRRRERRLASGDPELVWGELRDTAIDLTVPWPLDRSPRATRTVVVDYLGLPVDSASVERPAHGPGVAPAAVASLDRLVHTLELHRYSRSGAVVDPVRLRADGEECVAALVGGALRSARRRAAWWPRSVVGVAGRQRPASRPVEARYGGVVDRVG